MMTEANQLLTKKLRYMGRQYAAGAASRGGASGKHYLEEAAEAMESLQAQVDALAGALRGLHTVCTLALSDRTGKQFSYFETRAGTFVHAVEAMQGAESALAAAGR